MRPESLGSPHLYYLPTGFGPTASRAEAEERLAVQDLLEEEAGLRSADPRHRADARPTGLLALLRTALSARFDKVLLDPAAGMGISAWLATQVLAESWW